MNTYLQVLKQYATFNERASRQEYWVFALYNITFVALAIVLDNMFGIAMPEFGYGPIYGLYTLAVLIPGLAVAVRRLHDVGKSGWMIFIAFIPIVGAIWLIVLMATKSNAGENQYGAEPNNIQNNESITDELILLTIVWTLLMSAFWGIFPKVNEQFYDTSTFKITSQITPIIGGLITFALAFVVNKTSKRIFLIVIGGLILLCNFYAVIDYYINFILLSNNL
ncbi:hypothetical protein FUAX_44920 (plasmid) [Fulvitalea axinellae]|uniref:DUF805 domain-containing protein n=1 Tax=Fulvitalea axinellae TaxID=1182444 RepID=A0AAU9DHM6_9BACT|nr:hypothetical protein FUAX_44920 [Fulvitalea axinellae]